MQYPAPLILGKFIRRYKRFFVEVELASGAMVTAHTANTGSMKTALAEGQQVALSYHPDPKRKLAYSLELTHNGVSWIGVNTHLPNTLVKQALEQRLLPELGAYTGFQSEVKINAQSRLDFALDYGAEKRGYLEIKNVSMALPWAPRPDLRPSQFPDSVSARATKHLQELMQLRAQGHRTFCLFVIQRNDVDCFVPAASIDPLYAQTFQAAQQSGVEMLAYHFAPSLEGIQLQRRLEIYW